VYGDGRGAAARAGRAMARGGRSGDCDAVAKLGATLPVVKLSCLPVSFFQSILDGQMSLGEWVAFAKEIGLDGTECSLAFVQPIGKATASEMRGLCDDAGIAVSMVTCHPDFTHPDPAERARNLDDMRRNVGIAVELGAPLVRVLSGQRHPGVSDDQGIEWIVEGLSVLAREADGVGVRLAIENHTKSFFWQHFDFVMKGELFARMIEALRGTSVGVNFDTANPLVWGEETLPLFEQVKDRLAILHVADTAQKGEFKFCRIGQGIAPIQEVFRRARAQGFDGWVSIEEASRTGPDGFREAVRFVRKAWDEVAP
jgi:sugar phosphate isomerase/epimerase